MKSMPKVFLVSALLLLLLGACAGAPEDPPPEAEDPGPALPSESANTDEKLTEDTVEPSEDGGGALVESEPDLGVNDSSETSAPVDEDEVLRALPGTAAVIDDQVPDILETPTAGKNPGTAGGGKKPIIRSGIEDESGGSTGLLPNEDEISETPSPAPSNPLLETDSPAGATVLLSPADGPGEEVPMETDGRVSGRGDTDVPVTPRSVEESVPSIVETPTPAEIRDAVDDAPDLKTRYPALSAETPSRLLEEPGEFTVTLEGQGWVFRSDLSTPGAWRFLNRERAGDSTRFHFRFDEKGNWNLVFDRQDLSGGGSERTVRQIQVGDADTPIRIVGGEPADESASTMVSDDPESRNEAAEEASRSGRYDEAFSLWETDATRDGPEGERAREAIVREAASSGTTAALLAWLPAYLEDGGDSEVLEDALDVLEASAGYDRETVAVLEELLVMSQRSRKPEWLYRLARYLEKPGEDRDIDRAARLYKEVVDDWPFSDWRSASEERLQWLNRHYFRVR